MFKKFAERKKRLQELRKTAVFNDGTEQKKIKIFLIALVIMVMIFFSGFLGVYTAINFSRLSLLDMLLTLMPQSELESQTNILIVGLDETDNTQRSDTIMVLHINTNKNSVGVLSIPRDSRLEIPGRGMGKANHSYAYGGIELAKKTVSEFLQIPIDHYISINLKGVVNVIDELGGISLDIDKRMYYVDKAGDLYIDLKPGKQNLTGKEVMGYIRYRHDTEGDIGRISRQQNFIKAVGEKIVGSGKIFKAPAIFRQISDNFSSDLNTKQLFMLALQMRTAFVANRITVDTVPGAAVIIEGTSYWRPDMPLTIRMIDKVIHGIDHDSLVSDQSQRAVDKAEAQIEEPTVVAKADKKPRHTKSKNKDLGEPQKIPQRVINQLLPTIKPVEENRLMPTGVSLSVEVLNGCGVAGIARDVARELKDKNIKVPWVGNAAHFNYEKTIIVDWKGLTKETMQLALALKISPDNIVTYYKPDKKLDVTLVVGKDWLTYRQKK